MGNVLKNKRILITAGPTRGYIDAVRFLSNRSSGRLGIAMASEAAVRGADVTLVAGAGFPLSDLDRVCEGKGVRLKTLEIETVDELTAILKKELFSAVRGGKGYSAIVHAMAVLDYIPVKTFGEKVRSGRDRWTLVLKKTPKVISYFKKWSPESLLVGFKLESGVSEKQMFDAASALITSSGADMVVVNDQLKIQDGRHPALIISSSGALLGQPKTKQEIAGSICDLLSSEE